MRSARSTHPKGIVDRMELIKCVDVEWWNGMEGGDVDVVDARSL